MYSDKAKINFITVRLVPDAVHFYPTRWSRSPAAQVPTDDAGMRTAQSPRREAGALARRPASLTKFTLHRHLNARGRQNLPNRSALTASWVERIEEVEHCVSPLTGNEDGGADASTKRVMTVWNV